MSNHSIMAWWSGSFQYSALPKYHTTALMQGAVHRRECENLHKWHTWVVRQFSPSQISSLLHSGHAVDRECGNHAHNASTPSQISPHSLGAVLSDRECGKPYQMASRGGLVDVHLQYTSPNLPGSVGGAVSIQLFPKCHHLHLARCRSDHVDVKPYVNGITWAIVTSFSPRHTSTLGAGAVRIVEWQTIRKWYITWVGLVEFQPSSNTPSLTSIELVLSDRE
ncbi:hypothetical protein AVEN_253267-1 [Araneus ventricosus]|uniref:Uncharacterized protein n=1 Tax=Araneus ventricosus TaxID=182803 RepID=A0A4Y2SGU8_ARAVE|nr:hypothetical protein AVEN_253267-1 [Araneus ventricosus]